jgi:hypothetical protein
VNSPKMFFIPHKKSIVKENILDASPSRELWLLRLHGCANTFSLLSETPISGLDFALEKRGNYGKYRHTKGWGYSDAAGYPFSIKPSACTPNGQVIGPWVLGINQEMK